MEDLLKIWVINLWIRGEICQANFIYPANGALMGNNLLRECGPKTWSFLRIRDPSLSLSHSISTLTLSAVQN